MLSSPDNWNQHDTRSSQLEASAGFGRSRGVCVFIRLTCYRKGNPLSDVDVAIYPSRKLHLDDRLGIIQRLGKKTKLENLDVTFLDRLENLYILDAIIDRGIVLVDKAPDEREMFEVMAHHRFLDFQYQRKLYMGV